MAQYAYKYNDIYDAYLVQPSARSQAAPQRAPSRAPSQPAPAAPHLHKVKKRTKEQVIRENQRKFKIALARFAVIFALFASMLGMAAGSQAELESKKAELAKLNETYQLCLEENNQLKLQLDKMLATVNIDQIATQQLGLQKIPDSRKLSVDMSQFQ